MHSKEILDFRHYLTARITLIVEKTVSLRGAEGFYTERTGERMLLVSVLILIIYISNTGVK